MGIVHLEVRSVEEKTHEDTTKGTSNGDGHDPGEDQEADTLEVYGLEGAVAKTNTDGSSSNAHGGGDRQGKLGEDEDGDGGTHLHGAATTGGVVGNLVAHDCFLLVNGSNIVLELVAYPS